MKKILSLFTLIGAMTLTGCLKDKGFDNGEYGTEIKEVPGVAIPLSASSPNVIAITSQSTPVTVDGPTVTLEMDRTPTSDVQVTMQIDNSLVTAISGLTPLPAGSYTTTPLTFTIPAGQKKATVKITLPNSSSLDPTKTYGLGFRITSVSPGYTIAQNQKTVVFAYNIKNKYDGVYSLNLRLDGWAAFGIASGIAGNYPPQIELVTAGPDAVVINQLAPSQFGDLQPGFTGGAGTIASYTSFGAAGPKYTFNTTTDKVISVTNTYPDDGRGRAFYLDPASTTSQFTPGTRGIRVEYFMKQNGRPDMKITAIYTFLRDR